MKTKNPNTPKSKSAPTAIADARAKKGAAQPAATVPVSETPAEPPQPELTPEQQKAQARMDQVQFELGGLAVSNAAQMLVQGSAMIGEALIVPLDLKDQAGNHKAGYVVALFGEPSEIGKIAKVVGATIEGFRSKPAEPETEPRAKKAASKK